MRGEPGVVELLARHDVRVGAPRVGGEQDHGLLALLADLQRMVRVTEGEHRLPRRQRLHHLRAAARDDEALIGRDALLLEEALLPRDQVLRVDDGGDAVGDGDRARLPRGRAAGARPSRTGRLPRTGISRRVSRGVRMESLLGWSRSVSRDYTEAFRSLSTPPRRAGRARVSRAAGRAASDSPAGCGTRSAGAGDPPAAVGRISVAPRQYWQIRRTSPVQKSDHSATLWNISIVFVCVVQDRRWRWHEGQTYCLGFSGIGCRSDSLPIPTPGAAVHPAVQ